MASINLSAQQASIQFLGGLFIGGSIDSLFPSAAVVDNASFMKVAAEALGQSLVTAIVSASYFEWLMRRGVSDQDPTKGITFATTMIATQANLHNKLQLLSNYARNKIRSSYFGPAAAQAPPQAGITTGPNPNLGNPSNAGISHAFLEP